MSEFESAFSKAPVKKKVVPEKQTAAKKSKEVRFDEMFLKTLKHFRFFLGFSGF